MEYKAKSLVFGRMPRKEGADFKTAFFKLYDKENPMSIEISSGFPSQELEFPNIEKINILNSNLEYYLEGNDLVFNKISSIKIVQDENNLTISVK